VCTPCALRPAQHRRHSFGRLAILLLELLDVVAEQDLEDQGVHLDEPYTRQLRGKLRELRFYMGRERQRVTYYIASGRRIILLTVFRKTKAREGQEIDRAERAMQQCIASGHTAEDEDA
jgi:phage-related protein